MGERQAVVQQTRLLLEGGSLDFWRLDGREPRRPRSIHRLGPRPDSPERGRVQLILRGVRRPAERKSGSRSAVRRNRGAKNCSFVQYCMIFGHK
jgi:hypothetical protein